jgi:hypothetical protein
MQNTPNEKVPNNKTKKTNDKGKKELLLKDITSTKSKTKALCEKEQIHVV